MYHNSLKTIGQTIKHPLCLYNLQHFRNLSACLNCNRLNRYQKPDQRRYGLLNDFEQRAVWNYNSIFQRSLHSSKDSIVNSASTISSPLLKQQEEKSTQTQIKKLNPNVLFALKWAMKIYDFATLPLYTAIQQPWKVLAAHTAKKSKLINADKNIYGTVIPKSDVTKDLEAHGVTTLERAFSRAVEIHADRPCSGIREIISQHNVTDENGVQVSKYKMGEYKWKSFNEMDKIAENFSLGLASMNVNPKENIAIFAETREEWLSSVMAAFKRNIPVVTIFTILGNDGVIHAINETEVTCVITSEELMPRCKEIMKKTPLVKQLIYMPKADADATHSVPVGSYKEHFPANINLNTFQDVISKGTQASHLKDITLRPSPEDTAIIMYTSGSTGVPKGVILSHHNVITSLKVLADTLLFSVGDSIEEDAYIAYLPMAHIMELIGETFCLLKGIKIGFSSPQTLIDSSLAIHPGTPGDMFVLKPTVFPAAPLVLERICKGIKSKVEEKGLQDLFEYLYDYKRGWIMKGYKTRMLDKLFFKKIGVLMGGNVRLITCGGAPLAPHTHDFVRNVLCTVVCLSYGMTESSGLAAFTQSYDLNAGRVGGPIAGSTMLRIVNWNEGNYKVTDKPNPRGEVYIGGENVSSEGYFKRADTGDFFNEDGIRWVRTGDIVEVFEDGAFNIIDRKKDLIKLSTGEYVSLGKIESILKTNTLVENICVVADPFKPHTAAIIVPIEPKIKILGEQLGIQNCSLQELCKNPAIVQRVLDEIKRHGLQLSLEKYELPRKIYLSPDPWLPQSGLVTAALKNQRSNLAKHFQQPIQEML